LEVEVRVAKALLRPGVEVVAHSNGTRGALRLTNGPVLSKGARTSDGWLVGTSVGAEGVGAAIRLDRAKCLGTAAGIVGA
jgi:hypothetical protein